MVNESKMSKPKFSTHGKEWTMHSPTQSMWEILSEMDNVKIFTSAVEKFKLVDYFTGNDEYTIFIPVDSFFTKLSKEKLDSIILNPYVFHFFVVNHFVKGRHEVAHVKDFTELISLQNYPIKITNKYKILDVNGFSHFYVFDVIARNGVLHFIDHMILPPLSSFRGQTFYDIENND